MCLYLRKFPHIESVLNLQKVLLYYDNHVAILLLYLFAVLMIRKCETISELELKTNKIYQLEMDLLLTDFHVL